MSTASEQILKIKPKEVISLPEGSWGENNDHSVWYDAENGWTWKNIYDDEVRLNKIIEINPLNTLTEVERRVLTQALRELMLLQSSDWQFLIHTQSAKDYAENRFFFHNSDFNKLCDIFEELHQNKKISKEQLIYLEETEKRNSIFPELQLEWWKE